MVGRKPGGAHDWWFQPLLWKGGKMWGWIRDLCCYPPSLRTYIWVYNGRHNACGYNNFLSRKFWNYFCFLRNFRMFNINFSQTVAHVFPVTRKDIPELIKANIMGAGWVVFPWTFVQFDCHQNKKKRGKTKHNLLNRLSINNPRQSGWCQFFDVVFLFIFLLLLLFDPFLVHSIMVVGFWVLW